jgi:hypothetical protein
VVSKDVANASRTDCGTDIIFSSKKNAIVQFRGLAALS